MVEAPETPHQHHHKTGLPWFDFIVPVAVLCISVASLLTSLQSEKSMHALVEQNSRLVSAQSTPLLMLDTANSDDNGRAALSMTVTNVGTGPAQIAWFRAVDAQGNDFSAGALEAQASRLDEGGHFTTQQIAGTLLRSGDQRSVFRWPQPSDKPAALAGWKAVNERRFHLRASACYCSMFDECKITEFGVSKPKPVASCEEAAAPRP